MSRSLLAAAVVVTFALPVAIPGAAVAAGPCAHPTIQGTKKRDRLVGTPGPDVIAGGGGDDVLVGGGGDDVLCGGAGQDILRGGTGDDRLYGGTDAKVAEDTDYYLYYGDRLVGGPGDDLLDVGSDPRHDDAVDAVLFKHAPGPMAIDLRAGTATGEGTDTIVGPVGAATGSAYDDTIIGSDLSESLTGGAGSDVIRGNGGDDWLESADEYQEHPDRVPNTVIGGPGGDTVNGSNGDDLLRGGPGADLIQAGQGADRSYGGPGRDGINTEVRPGEHDLLVGGPGHDYLADLLITNEHHRFQRHVRGRIDMAAGTAVARFKGQVVRVTMRGFEDVSTPHGDLWTVFGTDGPDTILAGFSRDPVRIFARGGNDSVFGSDRDDVINGGPGFDTGTGWGGRDRVVSVEKVIRY